MPSLPAGKDWRQVCSPCIATTGEPAHPITREGLLLLTVLTQLTRLAAEVRGTEWRADFGRSQTVEITNQVCSLQQQMKHPLAVRFAGLMKLPAWCVGYMGLGPALTGPPVTHCAEAVHLQRDECTAQPQEFHWLET